MKLLFLCNLAPRKLGAFEDFIIGVGEELAQGGDTLVCIFSQEPCEEVAQRLGEHQIHWHAISGWADVTGVHPWAVCRPALRILQHEKPDVVAVHFGNELPLAFVIALSKLGMGRSTKWVWHQRQQISAPRTYLQRSMSRVRILAGVCDHFVALYQGGRASLRQRGVPDGRISTIYNGVPPFVSNRAAGWLRQQLQIPATPTLITNIGSLIIRKRIDLTIQAFATICNGHSVRQSSAPGNEDLPHLILVGEGPEEEHLRALAKAENVASLVHFMGRRNDVREILSESDLLLLSSDAEACPWAIIESVSVGIPCVSTDAGAACELIEDGVSGYVVKRGSAEELAAGISKLIDNVERRRSMGDESHCRWKSMFTRELVVTKHCRLYRSLAEKEVD
jgi:glycosyltransferase involved in cell wall biosynthesis